MATRIKLRRGTAAQWATANPILSLGEFGFEYNTQRFKIGDGNQDWNSLPYNEQIITLSGDVVGSGNNLINVTVVDDSHNHTTATLPNFAEDVEDVVTSLDFNIVNFQYGKASTKSVTLSQNNVATTLDSFNTSGFTTVDYMLQLKQGNKITSTKTMVMFDGQDVYLNEYSILNGTSGGVDASISASYSAGTVALFATSSSASSTPVTAKVFASYLKT